MRRFLAVLLVGSALLAAGCGSSGSADTTASTPSPGSSESISKTAFIEKADEACAEFDANNGEAANELDEAKGFPEVETALVKAMPLVEGTVKKFEQIPIPSVDPAGAESYLEKAKETVTLYRHLLRAVQTEDTKAVETYSAAIEEVSAEERRTSSAYGFHVCGH